MIPFAQAVNISCFLLILASIAFFFANKRLGNEVSRLASEEKALKLTLENIHQTCKDKVVSAFPRIPATHIVVHSTEEKRGLRIEVNVTFLLVFTADGKWPRKCMTDQLQSIRNSYPQAEILVSAVTQGAGDMLAVQGVELLGNFQTRAEALNTAIQSVKTPYFLILQPGFIMEPVQSDSSIEWLHHAMVMTPGVDIMGGSTLLANNELVIPCYSLNLCNWTLTQKYEYRRSFGEIMICDEVSQSFMVRNDVVSKFKGELFDKSLGEYIYTDFFLRAKKLELTIANRPEVMFVQMQSCLTRKASSNAVMDAALPFAKKYQIFHFKDASDQIQSICDGSDSHLCTVENVLKKLEFPKWHEAGTFAYPFVIKQAISVLEVIANQLHKADILFALRGETLFGAVMTKSVLPWGQLNSTQLWAFATKAKITKFAESNGYSFNTEGGVVTIMVKHHDFAAPMPVEILIKSMNSDKDKFANIRVNGKLYPVLSDPISELKQLYGEFYLGGLDSKAGSKFSCKLTNHHACLPDMETRGASTYQEDYCQI